MEKQYSTFATAGFLILKDKEGTKEGEFTQQLLHKERETVGRIDARFKGFAFDPLSQYADYDPLFPVVSPVFTAAFLDYIHGDLNFGKDLIILFLQVSSADGNEHIELPAEAGHMMYIREPSLEKMKQDLDKFYDETDRIK